MVLLFYFAENFLRVQDTFLILHRFYKSLQIDLTFLGYTEANQNRGV